jgi:phospholipase C
MSNLDGIKTIVIVMMENRSFDHLLGFMSHELFPFKRTDVDGLHQHSNDFDWDNPDNGGALYAPTATPDGYLPCDLPHSRKHVGMQLDSGGMTGFIKAYFDLQQIDRTPVPMRFCDPRDIPITAKLASEYVVCDKWFASLPDDTFPNRLMALSGYTRIDDTSVIKPPLHLIPDQTTIFDWLANKGKNFKIYVDAEAIANLGPPTNLWLMKSQWRTAVDHAHTFDVLAKEWPDNAVAAPDVIYCEPFYNDFATAMGKHGGCNHPPLPTWPGEVFLKKVYETLTSNPTKWANTMLVVCYDEHGGFFDHVAPPGMKYGPPADGLWKDPTMFTTLGVRVPGFVVSPRVAPKTTFHQLLDHTSILQLMVDKFGTANDDLEFFGDAPARKHSGVHSLAETITLASPRANDKVTFDPLPPEPRSSATTPPITDVGKMFRAVIADNPAALLNK